MCGGGARELWLHRLAPMPTGWDSWANHSAPLCLSLLVYQSGTTMPSSQVIVTDKIP